MKHFNKIKKAHFLKNLLLKSYKIEVADIMVGISAK